jgi:hypothetical protein
MSSTPSERPSSKRTTTQRIPNFLKENPKKQCITDDKNIGPFIKITKRIGTDSSYGEAFSACYPQKTCKNKLAIKKIPLTAREYAYENPLKSLKILNESEIWAELYFSRLASTLNEQKIVPHVPRYYTHYICDTCLFENEKISKDISRCIILPNDLADGDLKYFLTNKYYTAKTLTRSYIQIFLGILAINLYFKMDHNDLHYGNVLFKKVENGVNRYTLDSITYYIPNDGLLFYLWDFGFATITDFIEPKIFRGRVKKGKDYSRVTSMLTGGKEYDTPTGKETSEARDKTYEFLSVLVKTQDKLQMMKYLLSSASVPYTPDLNILGRYNLDKNVKIRNQPK